MRHSCGRNKRTETLQERSDEAAQCLPAERERCFRSGVILRTTKFNQIKIRTLMQIPCITVRIFVWLKHFCPSLFPFYILMMRSCLATAAISSGVVRQQPPISRAPVACHSLARAVMPSHASLPCHDLVSRS